jgi:hypothetical protein
MARNTKSFFMFISIVVKSRMSEKRFKYLVLNRTTNLCFSVLLYA